MEPGHHKSKHILEYAERIGVSPIRVGDGTVHVPAWVLVAWALELYDPAGLLSVALWASSDVDWYLTRLRESEGT